MFAFGPVGDIAGYGQENLPFNISNEREVELRSPVKWLGSIKRPTFVLEGTLNPSNLSELRLLSRQSKNPNLHFHPVRFADHFSELRPTTRVIASRIVNDAGPTCHISFTDAELAEAMRRQAN